MAECPNGTRPKAGSPEWFFFDRAAGPDFLGSIGSWLTNKMMGLDDVPQKTSDFCSRMPTGDLPTNGDILALADPPLALLTGAYSRFGNYVKASTFSQLCECSPPAGPGCTSRTLVISFDPRGPSLSQCGPLSYYIPTPTAATTFPSGQHRVRIQSRVPAVNDLQVDVYTDVLGQEVCEPWLAGQLLDRTYIASDTAAHFGMAFRQSGNPPSGVEGQTFDLSFSNTPTEPACAPAGTPIGPPAPLVPPIGFVPSPSLNCASIGDICTAIQALGRDLSTVILTTDLLQQFQVPFTSIDGAEHANLTGTGSFPISRLLGMRVYVVTPPPGAPVLPGNPPYLWDCGWMSIGNEQGMLEERRVTRSGFAWLPKAMQLATSFNWALTPGTVVTAIEVKPEQA